eukprot:scaffold53888_cov38-Tisochrysis_lutea.AAC.2
MPYTYPTQCRALSRLLASHLLLVFVEVFNEVERHFRPMSHRVEMVHDVVAIIESEHVERRSNQVDGEPIIGGRIPRVNELVLGEVSRHQRARSNDGRESERDPKDRRVQRAEYMERSKVANH